MEPSSPCVEDVEVCREAVASRFDAKPALLFENGDSLAAVGVAEIEQQVVGGVMLVAALFTGVSRERLNCERTRSATWRSVRFGSMEKFW
jgi:hypothetical protein